MESQPQKALIILSPTVGLIGDIVQGEPATGAAKNTKGTGAPCSAYLAIDPQFRSNYERIFRSKPSDN